MRRLPRSATLLILFLCGMDYSLAQSGDQPPPPPAIEYNERAWKEFSSAEGGFKVSMPGTPSSKTAEMKTAVGTVQQSTFVFSTGVGAYIVSYVDLPINSADPEVVKRALDAGRDNALAQNASNKLLSERETSLDGYAGREWLVDGGNFVLRARAYLVKGRLYQLVLVTSRGTAFMNARPSADPAARTDFYEMVSGRFLDSFRLTNAEEALGEVDRYLAREKAYGKVQGNQAGSLFEAGILQGRVRSLPQPAYPPIAKAVHASGEVTVKVVVDEEGKVVAAQAVSGHPLLQSAAIKAAHAAQFAPTLLEGKPVKVVGTISYNFVGQ